MEPLAELGGWDADDLREDAGKVIRVSEADGGGDLRNALIGETERTFGELHAYLVDTDSAGIARFFRTRSAYNHPILSSF